MCGVCVTHACVPFQDEKRKLLTGEMTIAMTRMRKRSLGNIRFIGELFKLQMLSETILHECITRLLKSSSDEESLECFSRLISTTGKDLDKQQAKVGVVLNCMGLFRNVATCFSGCGLICSSEVWHAEFLMVWV